MSDTLSFEVEGMTCGHCVSTVTTALEALPGVRPLWVTPGHPVEVAISDPATGKAAITVAIEEAGYTAVFGEGDRHGPR